VWVRLNAVVFFGLTVLLVLACLCAVSTYLHTGKPNVKYLGINTLRSLKSHGGVDRALISFDMDVDLAPAFNWNIKQLFVFVVAEYATKKNPLNQVIIWDKIIESKEDAHLKDYNVFVKYALIDQGKNLKDNNITLRMYWDHMPLTGRLYVHDDNSGEDSSFIMPSEYTAGKK